jgi:hypothetical protein
MTRPALVPFRAEHLLALVNRDPNAPPDWGLAVTRERGGPAYTALVGADVLGCGGVLLPWPGIGVAWLALSAEAPTYRVWLTRTVRRILDDVTRAYGLHRLEAVVRADRPVNQRWLKAFAFARENGCARAYMPDQTDAFRYERVRG